MDRTGILVTGVGGGVGQSILKSLADTPYRAVACDGEPLATGLYAAERGYLVPYSSQPEYVDRLLDILSAERCRLLIPGLDAELPVLARAREQILAAGAEVVVSAPEVVNLCDDKLETARFLEAHGLPAPATRMAALDAAELGFPLVLKPRRGGRRSLGVQLVRTRDELAIALERPDAANLVAQEHVDGDEYTCGTVNFHGRCHGVIVMRRVLRDGDTYKAFVVRDARIEETVRAAAEALRPHGACNFQLRLRDGRAVIFEINARCSGTTYCRTLAGFNEPLAIADFLLHGRVPELNVRPLSVLRYWKEFVVDDARIEHLRAQGTIDGDGRVL